MFIYVLRHTATGREYIGKTVEPLSHRLSGHKSRAKRGESYPLHEAIRADGIEAFTMELLAVATSHEELWRLERAFIAERNTLHPHGFNLVRGGRGNYGWKMPDETRQKIAAARIGQPSSNKGRQMSPAQCAAMSLARKGKPKTPAQLAAVRSVTARAASAASGRLNRGRRRNRAQWSEVQRRVHAERSPEAKARRNQKIADSKRAWWASLPPDARLAQIKSMSRGQTEARQGA
jgi:group I intron endonuclease